LPNIPPYYFPLNFVDCTPSKPEPFEWEGCSINGQIAEPGSVSYLIGSDASLAAVLNTEKSLELKAIEGSHMTMERFHRFKHKSAE
jgi:hypothetical protein